MPQYSSKPQRCIHDGPGNRERKYVPMPPRDMPPLRDQQYNFPGPRDYRRAPSPSHAALPLLIATPPVPLRPTLNIVAMADLRRLLLLSTTAMIEDLMSAFLCTLLLVGGPKLLPGLAMITIEPRCSGLRLPGLSALALAHVVPVHKRLPPWRSSGHGGLAALPSRYAHLVVDMWGLVCGYARPGVDVQVSACGYAHPAVDVQVLAWGYARPGVDVRVLMRGYARLGVDVQVSACRYARPAVDVRVLVCGCWRADMHVRLWTSRSRRADTRVQLWTCGCRCAALLLGGDFFTGTVLASALTTLVLWFDEKANDKAASNVLRAEVPLLSTLVFNPYSDRFHICTASTT
ncbi:hypothetical protein DFH08DRAFT_1023269 [Mycena albidolilacea]|uniref:Uncharacterized protein n=1 Tax=Mycena albidolilacea TaxID=1033008 RepID=A0AAD7EKF1_9AGAR|nr:hypothetical protein DFH08DRAFT_1023269 [Mycena albidolilacea]